MPPKERPLTGRKVLLITVAAFAVVVAANLAMLFAATGTFPGLVVKNSYVASQNWDAKTGAQRALGWKAAAEYTDGFLRIVLIGPDGAPVRNLRVAAVVGRPAGSREDVRVDLTEQGEGYVAALEIAPGLWRLTISAGPEGEQVFEAEAEFYVRAPS